LLLLFDDAQCGLQNRAAQQVTQGSQAAWFWQILVPIHWAGGPHWGLGVINITDEKLEYYDSLAYSEGEAIFPYAKVMPNTAVGPTTVLNDLVSCSQSLQRFVHIGLNRTVNRAYILKQSVFERFVFKLSVKSSGFSDHAGLASLMEPTQSALQAKFLKAHTTETEEAEVIDATKWKRDLHPECPQQTNR
jgi:hypothetical protein